MDNNEFQFVDISSSSKPNSSKAKVSKKTGKIRRTAVKNTKKAARI